MVRATMGALATVIAVRVLGVSLLLAGFVDYGHSLGGETFETGLAFGAYPLALALFMLPMGHLSDRVGRRPVLVGGLVVSAVGGVLAAFAPTVLLLGIGRFIQGAGAINGVALAVAGEVGEPERRTRRFALLGAAAGGGFVLGLVLGALLLPLLGIPGLLLAFSALNLGLAFWVARAVGGGRPHPAPPTPMARDAAALWLGFGAFAVNFSLTGLLFLSPLLLDTAAPGASHELLLVAMVIPGGLGMFVAARLADRGHALAVGLAAALLLGMAPLAFLGTPGAWLLLGAGVLFFVGHSALSSLLPALAAARATEGRRGAAQGLQSTLQYLGSFAGSALVAALYPSRPLLAAAFLGAGLLVGGAVLVARS